MSGPTTGEPVPVSEIPAYLRNATPVPLDKRAPWYMNTAPTYAGIFLWFAFYQDLGEALRLGELHSVLIGIILAGLVCHLFFYYVPGMLGMKTGLPLYIVGTSTFGVKGGYFIPGIFMGLLQIGWYSVATYFATQLVLGGLEIKEPIYFYILAPIWGFIFAMIGALGIGYVAKMSQFFPIVPIIMLIIGAVMAVPYIGSFTPPTPLDTDPKVDTDILSIASLLIMHMIVGFFGTAGAVGADFCSNNRNASDVKMGGIAGIWLAVMFAAGLAVITVAGAHGENKDLVNKPKDYAAKTSAEREAWDKLPAEAKRKKAFEYSTALESLNTTVSADGTAKKNWLANGMLLLFAVGSMAPACFCSFIIGNSLSTMLGRPKSRIPITLAGAGVGVAIALTGLPANLAPIFGLIGASFGPVIGAMIADYVLNGGNWSGPREGINWAGYGAWLIGFLVGISNNEMIGKLIGFDLVPGYYPTGVFSLIIGFLVYILLARTMGLPARLEGVVKTVSGQV